MGPRSFWPLAAFWLQLWPKATVRQAVTGCPMEPAPSPKPRQKPKILAAQHYIFSVNALAVKRHVLWPFHATLTDQRLLRSCIGTMIRARRASFFSRSQRFPSGGGRRLGNCGFKGLQTLSQRLRQRFQAGWALGIAGALTLAAAGQQWASASIVVNFAPGVEASPTGLTSSQITGLRAANFNTLVLFSMTVETNGDFYYGGGGGPNILLCTNGVYVGPANWGSLLSQCEASPSSISRIEMCIGGWGDQSFLNIKNLIAANGTGSGTVLYQNLSALKNALALNAMDYDDEYEYNSSSAISFGQMCAAAGMKVTLCPYTNPSYWQAVKSGLGTNVDYVYLQCYSGGQGNDAATWSGYFDGLVPVLPGDWDADSDIGFLDLMHTGAKEGCVGGWFWPNEGNGTVSISTLDYFINLIRAGFGPNIYWQGGAADYDLGANWMGGVVPGAGTNAINDSGSNNVVEINAGDPDWTLNDLWAGDDSGTTGAYVQNGSTVSVGTPGGWVRLGDNSGAVGYYTLNGGTLNATNNFDIGEAGTGVLNVNGGLINIGSAGLFDISDGGTKGVVIQTNGAVNCSAQMWLGENFGTGSYTLSGGELVVHNWVAIGRNGGTGTLIMTGGSLNQNTSGNFVVGTDGGLSDAGDGMVQQSGGTIHVVEQLLIPQENTASVGTYNLSGSGNLIVDDWLAIGRGGAGYLNMSGGAITKTAVNGGNLDLGAGGAQNGGAGTLTQTGGFITNTAEGTWLGEVGNATWNLDGGTDVLGQVYMCINDLGMTATLNLNGGLFRTTGMTNNTPTGDTSILNFNGGVLQAGASNPNFVSGLSQALVMPGGAVIDSQNYSITVAQALLADGGGGGLTKLGTGILTLTGTNTYTGPTVITRGTLDMTGSGQVSQSSQINIMPGTVLNVTGRSDGTLTLNSGQTLTGGGSVDGKLSALTGSTINPGEGIGTLTVQNNVTLGGQLLMELNRTNVQDCDELVSSDGSIGGGGVLTITNAGPPLQLGDTFQLFNKAVTGFNTINLPNVAPYSWANNLAVNGTMQVAAASANPTNIITRVTGNNLVLSWPADHTGWWLQSNTNLAGTNWTDLAGSTATNQVIIPINPTNGGVFFRLMYEP